ncbi:Uncharacterised protein [Salmonella enterica subsp. diarizonae]|uniref:Uncharacterized protein n=1 Tax=Salmonella diarizonae TaxID=59204 RepID=A0A379U1K5_SALDZ|nr:Uncharacterised protein [Salmonella enterica subsp. diarizonae]
MSNKNARLSGRLGKSAVLSGLVFLTDTGKNVEHLTQTVNQTEDDGHHYRYHDDGKYQTFNNSNMGNSRYSPFYILTA